MLSGLGAWVPRTTPVSVPERLRSALGALVGILATGLLSRWAVGDTSALPILIAPMGASAVLLFAVPSSPLAQPWSIMGGNVLAALVGVSVALLVADPLVASAVAIGVTILLTMTFRCVHPPSGAVALTAVLGGHAIQALGYGFVVWPVGANSVLLLGVALLFNRGVGRSYPHRPQAVAAGDAATGAPTPSRASFSTADLDAVLAERDALLEVDKRDLEAILRQAELRAWRRRTGQATCAAVMVRNVTAISPDAPVGEALALLRGHRIKTLPVTDERARVVGIVTQTDLLEKAVESRPDKRLDTYRRRLSIVRGRPEPGSVAAIMTVPATTVASDTPLADVLWLMGRTGLSHLPVVDTDEKLSGIVAQSDLVVWLLAEGGAALREG